MLSAKDIIKYIKKNEPNVMYNTDIYVVHRDNPGASINNENCKTVFYFITDAKIYQRPGLIDPPRYNFAFDWVEADNKSLEILADSLGLDYKHNMTEFDKRMVKESMNIGNIFSDIELKNVKEVVNNIKDENLVEAFSAVIENTFERNDDEPLIMDCYPHDLDYYAFMVYDKMVWQKNIGTLGDIEDRYNQGYLKEVLKIVLKFDGYESPNGWKPLSPEQLRRLLMLVFEDLVNKVAQLHANENSSDDNDEKDCVNDVVNHPSHYTDGKYEVIDFILGKNFNFNEGNAVKYISRAGKKDPTKTIEDLKKSMWYIKTQISLLLGEKGTERISAHDFINDKKLDFFRGRAIELICEAHIHPELSVIKLESAANFIEIAIEELEKNEN